VEAIPVHDPYISISETKEMLPDSKQQRVVLGAHNETAKVFSIVRFAAEKAGHLTVFAELRGDSPAVIELPDWVVAEYYLAPLFLDETIKILPIMKMKQRKAHDVATTSKNPVWAKVLRASSLGDCALPRQEDYDQFMQELPARVQSSLSKSATRAVKLAAIETFCASLRELPFKPSDKPVVPDQVLPSNESPYIS
jgi:hypothetical protein